MLLPKPVRKFIAVFRGEVSPTLILLSTALGFWFGITPGWYGLHVALLLIALVLNIHVGIFLIFAGLGKAFCFAAAPLLFHVGKWTLATLTPVLDFLAALPVVGVTDFARYSVAGSLVLGPLLGLVCGVVLARSVAAFRRAWLTLEENSEAFRKWHSNRWVRFLDRLLIGKRAKDVRAVLKRRARIVRVAGLVVAVLVLAVSGIGLYFVQGARLTDLVADSLTKANGAEVNLESLEVAVLSGRISAKGIQVTDPDEPSRNRVAVSELTADASLWDLCRGRLVMDNVVLADVQINQPRETPGDVTAAPSSTRAPQFDPVRFNLSAADIAKAETYFEDVEKIRRWFQELAQWLPESESVSPAAAPPVPQSYLEYLSARAPVLPTPRILLRRAVLADVRVPAEQFGICTITCTNLNDAPSAAGLPVTITLQSSEPPTSISLVCHYERPEGGVELNGTLDDIDLRELQSELSRNNPVVFEAGTAAASISGSVTRETIDVAIQVQTRGMQARTSGGNLFGLDPQIASEAIRLLENVETRLRLVGPTAEPRLVFDRPALTDEFKEALLRAGKDELARRLTDALGDQLPAGVPDPGKLTEDPLGAAKEGLGGLLGGKSGRDDSRKKREEKKDDNP